MANNEKKTGETVMWVTIVIVFLLIFPLASTCSGV